MAAVFPANRAAPFTARTPPASDNEGSAVTEHSRAGLFGHPGRDVVRNWWVEQSAQLTSNTMTFPAGTRLGSFEVERLIASGGMADVYRARATRLNRMVALKVLAPAGPVDADRLARFAQEARTTALLNHPNIVGVYDVGSHEG